MTPQIPAMARNFNPRTHVGCDPASSPSSRAHSYFNPRTHVGCDLVKERADRASVISIHAPTWGATNSRLSGHLNHTISIHAPTWGATRSEISSFDLLRFQSTHPRGVRPAEDWDKIFLLSNFNPRTHVGCDPQRGHPPPYLLKFQSTHPRGVRLYPLNSGVVGKEFQSTHPRGVRPRSKNMSWLMTIFQSTHPRGVRRFVDLNECLANGISIHAPTWGAT